MNTINQVTVMGRITADPELRTTPAGIDVCSFSVAVDRPYRKSDEKERETDFFRVVAWRNNANYICTYYKKGDLILLSGVLRNSQYQIEGEEKPRKQTEIVVRDVFYSGRKNTSSGDSDPDVAAYAEPIADEAEELMI